ncbi:unnamed protein product [Calypogeia fissa]
MATPKQGSQKREPHQYGGDTGGPTEPGGQKEPPMNRRPTRRALARRSSKATSKQGSQDPIKSTQGQRDKLPQGRRPKSAKGRTETQRSSAKGRTQTRGPKQNEAHPREKKGGGAQRDEGPDTRSQGPWSRRVEPGEEAAEHRLKPTNPTESEQRIEAARRVGSGRGANKSRLRGDCKGPKQPNVNIVQGTHKKEREPRRSTGGQKEASGTDRSGEGGVNGAEKKGPSSPHGGCRPKNEEPQASSKQQFL